MPPSISSKRIMPNDKDINLNLTHNEEKFCNLLNDYTAFLKQKDGICVTCRIAGGWVRDKILGQECDDINVALDQMMGPTFAESLRKYAESHNIPMGNISKIASNPDQSKHLETAKFKLFGLDVDVVNLRSEEYASDSRIPSEVSYGTPLQDTLRRDLTINGLFFNVHTRTVEDFTGKGIQDLRDGVIRTPIDPISTFTDDPLRVLRCVRFASRLGFRIVDEVKAAIQLPEIQSALKTKISRERCGEEFTKMLKGTDPVTSIKLTHELDLYYSLFCHFKGAKNLSSSESGTSVTAATILHTLLGQTDSRLPAVHQELLSDIIPNRRQAQDDQSKVLDDQSRAKEGQSHTKKTKPQEDKAKLCRLYLACALTPLQGKKSNVTVSIEQSLKLGRRHLQLLFDAADLIAQNRTNSNRVDIGILLREKCIHNPPYGADWTGSALFSLVLELVPFFNADGVVDVASSVALINEYNTFVARIIALNLQDVGEMEFVVTGKDILNMFRGKKPGPWVKKALDDVVKWQLGNPMLEKEECLGLLKERYGSST